MDRNLNGLLKWGIEHSSQETNGTNGPPAPAPGSTSNLNPELLNAILGGPSEADLMKAAMAVVTDPDPAVTLENKLIAFDNFEQLIESLDNANNMQNLALWSPLLSVLDHEEAELRRMAAWCVGTAVQNNEASQERLLAMGGIPRLVRLATSDAESEAVRRKAIYALSSAVRNYQPAMDVATGELAKHGHDGVKIDAQNMAAIDEMMDELRDKAVSKPTAA